MHDYVEILEAQNKGLQSLVAELLVKNQQLREELAKRPEALAAKPDAKSYYRNSSVSSALLA